MISWEGLVPDCPGYRKVTKRGEINIRCELWYHFIPDYQGSKRS